MEPKFAPYAPPSAVIKVIRHFRTRDVPERVTVTNLLQIGVTEGLTNRTMAALRFLGLVREDETTTEQLRALRFANDQQYEEVLGGILDAAYRDVLDVVDLSTATDRDLNNAFIPYSPGGQRGRMITLFLALAKEAGRTPAVEAKVNATRPSKLVTKTRTLPKRPAKEKLQPPRDDARNATIAFGISDSDLAALPDEEFEAVWEALGKLARARAKAARESPEKGGQ